jgi:DNA-directed RNA polymerase specialized sigma24 family protein
VLPAGFDVPGDALDPVRILGDRQRTRQVLAELRRLPARQRDALVGHAVHGRSARDLATSLGTSEKAVKALTHRGRTTMQRRAGRGR